MPKIVLSASVCAVLSLYCASGFAQIEGSVSYTGSRSGPIFVEAFTDDDETFEKLSVSLDNPGQFSFPAVEDGSYNVVAFIDENLNARVDHEEPWVAHPNLVAVPPGDSNISLNLDDWVPPGADGPDGEDGEGCCATVASAPGDHGAVLLSLALICILARRRFAPDAG